MAAPRATSAKPRRRTRPDSRPVTSPKLSDVQNVKAAARRMIRGTFDAAQPSEESRRHWSAADALSADAAACPLVRQTLRNRARYECANNSYARGMLLTLANDTIGSGPRLQLRLEDVAVADRIEEDWQRWADEIRLAEKLRCMRMAKAQDGEAFGLIITNPGLRHPVKLDLQLIEAEQVAASHLLGQKASDAADGIELDVHGNPVAYRVLRTHPGALGWGGTDDAIRVMAASVLHLYRMDRPGQHRGLPEIMPALPLFALLRRYTLATLMAAEVAASIGGVLQTQTGAAETPQGEPFDLLEITRNMLMTLPDGYALTQFKAEQPASTYDVFKRAVLCEIARCMNLPYNVAAGDSSGYNYASGRLDHQTYFRSIDVERHYFELAAVDRILAAWLLEYWFLTGVALERPLAGHLPPHEWQWDGREHVDPVKEATATKTRLESGTTTLAAEYARQGKDWEAELRQYARERALMKELGIELPTQGGAQDAVPE